MSFWSGMLVGAVVGVVATVGAEVAVACLAYGVYRVLVRIGLIKVETIVEKPPLVELA